MTQFRTSDLPESVTLDDSLSDYPVLIVENEFAIAKVALHGAHLFLWQPLDEQPVIWTSRKARLEPGKAIRGGIPICWPWFGPHPEDPKKPAHGFARNQFWQFESASETEDKTILALSLTQNEFSAQFWPSNFRVVLELEIGKSLTARLTMTHLGENPQNFTCALHSYFRVSDIDNISIQGLHGTSYLDQLQSHKLIKQEGNIVIDNELDRIYQNTQEDVLIKDKILARNLRISKTGSDSTVVWNPWVKKSAAMSDFEESGHRHMVCIETCNAGNDTITLKPGQSHVISTNVVVEPYFD